MDDITDTKKTYSQEETAKFFDKGRSRYAYQLYKHKLESGFLRKIIEKTPKESKLKVLDVACGTGRMLDTVFSSRRDIEYTGLDTSEAMTKNLKEKAKDKGYDVGIKIGDALNMPFKDNTFDIVYTFHLTWHLSQENQKKLFKEMLRVTKKDGYMVFDVLNKDFVYEGIKNILGKRPTKGVYKIDIKDVKGMFEGKQIHKDMLCDAPIENRYLYSIFNILNHARGLMPQNLYHMVYFAVKK